MQHGHWKFFYFNEPEALHISVNVELKHSTGSVVVFTSENKLPTFSSFSSFISLSETTSKGLLTFNNTEVKPKNYTLGIFGLCCKDSIVSIDHFAERQSVSLSNVSSLCK